MNRKQKIIVSVTGIFIVLLILVGLTYAYFLTRIQGNTNTKSISVTTANLELVYGDGTQTILKNDIALEPDSDNAIGTKDFTVTNKGNDTSYVVIIEDVNITNASDGSTTTFNSNDFRYTLTCTKKDGTSCDGVNTQTIFPLSGGILVGNSIKEGDVHTYVLTMWYIETGIDQSKDMGKTLQAKVNITNIQEMVNPYSSNKNSLAYNIIENAKNKANGTELLSSPRSKVAKEVSYAKGTGKFTEQELDMSTESWWCYESSSDAVKTSRCMDYQSECNDTLVGKYIFRGGENTTSWHVKSCKSLTVALVDAETLEYEKNMSVAIDDYGNSYYYRGNVIDNYVDFAGMCWRAVRIAGDGSIKLILEDQDSTCVTSDGNWNIPTTTGGSITKGKFGYIEYAANTLTASDGTKNSSTRYLMNYLNGVTNNDKSMATAFKNFQIGPLANYLDKLKAGDWCLDDTVYDGNITPLTKQEVFDKQIKGERFYYDSYERLSTNNYEPTLKCSGTNMDKFADSTDMYVGTLTADEISLAGGKIYINNRYFYLINEYQQKHSLGFWSLSPSGYSFMEDGDALFALNNDGGLGASNFITFSLSFRPSVNLKSSVQITGGDGTISNPYVIS